MNSMLTLDEVKNFLEIDQKEVEKCIQKQKLHAYKIGGTYLRFRREEVINLKSELKPSKGKMPVKRTIFSKIADFWRFNNFYIISIALVVALIVLVIKL